MKRILVINPGGSSTKISVFEDKVEVLKTNINHSGEELKPYAKVMDQKEFRKNLIIETLGDKYPLTAFDAVVGRGGLMREIQSGTYQTNDLMIVDMEKAIRGEHASNLGCVLAKSIGDAIGKPSFVVDPVSVDEFADVARITGIKDLSYSSWMHALNHKAVTRLVSEKVGKPYAECNFIVAHLGSGISIVAHKDGKMVDGSGGRTNGPFAADRSGGLPAYALIELCYSGKYSHKEMVDKVSAFGGFYDYLGTKDLIAVEKRIASGDAEAKLIMDAFIYQVAKEICSYGVWFDGKVDRVIMTGGIAHSKLIMDAVREKVSYLAPMEIVAGEMEMEALAFGTLRVLNGEEEARVYC
ncbi:butyrate kinase [Chakrabartyella piscis]|uniref:butyrate kinase n=1 Tax=Chakrabartyella piscis TaxID=2918914 RepID=UPI002958C7D8|nr:butyrate kinase [Chakrabartyella piscis]